MKNLDIRKAARVAGVFLWEIAREMGITDSSMSRKLREEFSPEQKSEVLAIIERLGAGR